MHFLAPFLSLFLLFREKEKKSHAVTGSFKKRIGLGYDERLVRVRLLSKRGVLFSNLSRSSPSRGLR